MLGWTRKIHPIEHRVRPAHFVAGLALELHPYRLIVIPAGAWYGLMPEARPRGMAPCGCPVHPGASPPVRPDAAAIDFERRRCEANASERLWMHARALTALHVVCAVA